MKPPDLLGDRALPCSQEGISHGTPPCDHIAAACEELRLSGVWLEVSVTELLGDALHTVPQIAGIAPERCAMDGILETRPVQRSVSRCTESAPNNAHSEAREPGMLSSH